ncbi:MAG: methylated-DNA--[protein]-cysteine S-methyltransferase [Thermoplasmataceae archaeon]
MMHGAIEETKPVETIYYSTMESEFGILAVAFTKNGICAVTLSGSVEEAEAYLRKEYPKVKLLERSENSYPREILASLDGKNTALPLDLKGTDFQKEVWQAIRNIPYGSTATYSEIASNIGRPRSYRAVANACADNPVPLIVPCHRVVRKNGDLGGYGLGIDTKRKLIDYEKSKLQSSTL